MGQHAVATVSDPSETGKVYQVLRELHLSATKDGLLVMGHTFCPGRCRWVEVNTADTSAQRDTAVRAALQA